MTGRAPSGHANDVRTISFSRLMTTRWLRVLGIVLLLGGVGHVSGVTHLYITQGLPEANRVLIDMWVGEAQLLAGALYLAAFRASRQGAPWRALAAFGAFTIFGYAVAILPVLFARAPALFRVPAIIYLVSSVGVLASTMTASDVRR